ncbi:MAG: glycosyltransferase [Lachnospiraceae bacterium]|nr:glycosyltransferase [Lachnospiraceae bacterium]
MLKKNVPLVSIIIPVYNGYDYISEAIDSALAQTYDNCEVIVVNDGSTDATEEIVLSYGDRVRYYAKKNGGVATALNLGIENMKGEYFAWLSHDDIFYPEKIEKQMEALEQCGDMKAPLYGNWDKMEMPRRIIRTGRIDARFSKEEWTKGVFPVLFGLVNGCTVLIHRSHFERVGLFKEELITSQDYDMWFRIFRGQKLVYVEEPLIAYRSHEKQGSNTIKEFKANCEEIQLDMIEKLTQDELERIFNGKYKFYFDMMRHAAENGWTRCQRELYELFLREESDMKKHKEIKSINEPVVLYCAGKNGRYLQKELSVRNIEVKAFSDGNSSLWGKDIDGIKCISPNEIPKDSLIIVTKDNPKELMEILKKQGLKKVMAYEDIASEVFESIPKKELVIKYCV